MKQQLLLSLTLLLSGYATTACDSQHTMNRTDNQTRHSELLKEDLMRLLEMLDASDEQKCCSSIMTYIAHDENATSQELVARVLSEAFSVLNNNKKAIDESSFHQLQTALINHSLHLCPTLLATSGCAAMLQEYTSRGMSELDLLGTQDAQTTRGLAIDANTGITANSGPIINLQGGNTLISGTLLLNPSGTTALSATGTIGTTSLQLNATGSGSVTQRATPTTTSYTLTWPNAVASSPGQALTSDTNGNLSWTSIVSPANAIVNGGNTFGTAISIGSNDGFSTSIRTNGTDRLTVSATGAVTIPALTPAGVVHNNASGLLSTSLIVNADVDPAAAIVDTKLATISTAGKVANSATSATSSNAASTIVMRDASGNFSAGTITANLTGTATNATTAVNFSGSLSGDVTGTQSATVVSFVGGESAANVASATASVLSATSSNVGSRLVLRDASGNFSGSAIGATSLLLNASGSGTLTQKANASTTSYSVTWPGTVASSSGQALTSDTSGNLSWTSVVSPANAIVNGGNTFGTTISIGSNDGFSTSIRTNGTDRLTISATGGVTILTNLDIPNTTSSVGLISKAGSPFIHNFGTNNTFVGVNSGNLSLTGTNNAALGEGALSVVSSGANNTAIGQGALGAITTGSNNIALGHNAGATLTGGDSNNIMIGATGTAGDSGTIRIGTNGVHNATYVTGIAGVNVGSNSAAVFVSSSGNTNQLGTVPSSRRFKDNIRSIDTSIIDKVMKLNPVSFTYRSDSSRFVDYGLIAEEVAEMLPGLVAYDDNKVPFTVRYHVLPSLLLQIVKNQQESLEACHHEIRELKHEAMEQRKKLEQLSK